MTEVSDQRLAFRNQRAGINRQDAACAERFLCVLHVSPVKPISDLRLLISGLFAILLALSFSAHAQENFFQGKSIRVIRGGQPGDLYDLWTRHIATYLGKHIPGTPSVTVQNMPGAGSVIAARSEERRVGKDRRKQGRRE